MLSVFHTKKTTSCLLFILYVVVSGCGDYDALTGYYGLALVGGGSVLRLSEMSEISNTGVGTIDENGTFQFDSESNDGDAGFTTAYAQFQISNTSDLYLSNLQIILTGDAASSFDLDTSALASELAPGASTTFQIRFDPLITGSNVAYVNFVSDGNSNDSYAFQIQGTGIKAYRIFVTNISFYGDHASSLVDQSCQYNANNPDGVGTGAWKAMRVDPGFRRACILPNCTDPVENQDWVFKPNTRYFRSDGSTYLFITNSAGIFQFGTLANEISSIGYPYWTGLQADWRTHADTCGGWGWSVSLKGANGRANETSSAVILQTTPDCSIPLRLLCVEQ